MHRKLQIFLSVALGAALLVAPSLGNIGSDSIYDSAFAAKGGNGKGNSANSSNAGGSSKSAGGSSKSNGANKSASLGTTSVGKSKKEKSLTSQMGALNAAHASAQAFANPNPNSRVGRIKAAVMATAATVAAQTAYDAAVQTAIAADPAVVAAQANVTSLQTQFDAATDPVLKADLGTQLTAAKATLASAQATAATTTALADPAVVAAQGTLDAANLAEGGAWDAAANKALTDDVKQATIDLVGDKVDTSVVTAPTPTPTP